jgi:catechol 2,3-dioxygenase-like lactoylglutathione lyase family enzyme
MAIVPIRGLFEAHLNVSSLDRSIEFYRDVLGLELAHRIPERHCAFFWMGLPGQTMLGLWSIYTTPIRARLHIAFRADLEDVIASVERLRATGIPPRSTGGGSEIDEPRVAPWRPAATVFFDDPDGHSLEFTSSLSDSPRPDLDFMPLST